MVICSMDQFDLRVDTLIKQENNSRNHQRDLFNYIKDYTYIKYMLVLVSFNINVY